MNAKAIERKFQVKITKSNGLYSARTPDGQSVAVATTLAALVTRIAQSQSAK